jgi:hypothetical protein
MLLQIILWGRNSQLENQQNQIDMDRLNFKKLRRLDGREKYQVKFPNRLAASSGCKR